MTDMKPLSQQFRSFTGDESGTVTIYSALMLVAILTISGAAVDIMQHESNRAIVQGTLDRAVLAAADLDQKLPPKSVVEDYIAKTALTGVQTTVSVKEAVNSRTVAATGTSVETTNFLRMSGVPSFTTVSQATAEEKISNVEISLVLDISGSMRFNDRIGKLRPAAKAFVSKVMTDDSNGVTTLNLVPFAGQVNPGDILFDYFRGERPVIEKHANNGYGNGDQDAPGNSLCNNNAENADEGAAAAECQDDTNVEATTDTTVDSTLAGPTVVEPVQPVYTTVTAPPDSKAYFANIGKKLKEMTFYFDTDGDDIYNVAHRVTNFANGASKDPDDIFKGYVASFFANESGLTDPTQFLGASVKYSDNSILYYQVKGDENGENNDIGPTVHTNNPGNTYTYKKRVYQAWEDSYVSPNQKALDEAAQYLADVEAEAYAATQTAALQAQADAEYAAQVAEAAATAAVEAAKKTPPGQAKKDTNVNMPSSCVEIYDAEFSNTAMPTSEDYVPHFMYYPIDWPTMNWGWCPTEETTIQYYSDDAETLNDFIENMRLHDGTGLQYGMKYGLALLDPDNREALSALIDAEIVDERFRGRPIDWHDDETEKYIVLMSDGGVTNQWRPTHPDDTQNAVIDLQTRGSSYYTVDVTAATGRAQYRRQCDLAKQKGVTVFTIAFETSTNDAADLAYCASSASHAFHVKGDEIADTFDTIARQINNLRLIQ